MKATTFDHGFGPFQLVIGKRFGAYAIARAKGEAPCWQVCHAATGQRVAHAVPRAHAERIAERAAELDPMDQVIRDQETRRAVATALRAEFGRL